MRVIYPPNTHTHTHTHLFTQPPSTHKPPIVCVDMKEVEKLVRSIATDGLLWGACKFQVPYCVCVLSKCVFYRPIAKLVPLAYGIKKLQISCVVEDEKVCVCVSVCLSVCLTFVYFASVFMFIWHHMCTMNIVLYS